MGLLLSTCLEVRHRRRSQPWSGERKLKAQVRSTTQQLRIYSGAHCRNGGITSHKSNVRFSRAIYQASTSAKPTSLSAYLLRGFVSKVLLVLSTHIALAIASCPMDRSGK